MYKFSQLVIKRSQPYNLKLILQKLQKSHISGNAKKFFTFIGNKKALINITNKSKLIRNTSTIYKNKKSNERIKTSSKQTAEKIISGAAINKCVDQGTNKSSFPMSSENLNNEDFECDSAIEISSSDPKFDSNEPLIDENKRSTEVYSRFRDWDNTSLGNYMKTIPTKGHGLPFTLVSYNILAQSLLEKYKDLYKNHSQNFLHWNERLNNLKKEILTIRPHILCLQEVQENHLSEILENIKELNLDYIYKKNTGERNDGCAILYNKTMFHLAEHRDVEFYQPNIYHLDRHNVGIIAKLCSKVSLQACILVGTAHLLYNPNRQDVRLAQIQVFLAELDRYSTMENKLNINGDPKRIPIILTGDFNLEPFSAPYKLIAEGKVNYENLTRNQLQNSDKNSILTGRVFLPHKLGITDSCQHIDMITNCYQGSTRLSNFEANDSTINRNDNLLMEYPGLFSTGKLTHNLNLSSVYRHRSRDGFQESSTFQDLWINVDYIFYSKYFSPKINSICEGYLKLLSRYSLPSVEKCTQMGLIPNSELGSDHLALAAKFFLKFSN